MEKLHWKIKIALMSDFSSKLNIIAKIFGVQPRFIIAILGMESFYGKNQGKIRTIDAVTTLAFDRRRSDFYKKQLFAALQIIDQDLRGYYRVTVGYREYLMCKIC